MRLTYPLKDILQHCDDINSAFRCILYHPDLAIVFAYVLSEHRIVPVGQGFWLSKRSVLLQPHVPSSNLHSYN